MRLPQLRRARNQAHQAQKADDTFVLEAAARAAAQELVMSARLDDIPTDLLLAPLEDLALDRAARSRFRAFRP